MRPELREELLEAMNVAMSRLWCTAAAMEPFLLAHRYIRATGEQKPFAWVLIRGKSHRIHIGSDEPNDKNKGQWQPLYMLPEAPTKETR